MMNNVVDISDWEAAAVAEARQKRAEVGSVKETDAVQRASVVAPFTFVAVGDLEPNEPEFLIDGLIETDTLGLIFGDPACGKTFAVVDMAMCVATGVNFHGCQAKQGAVFYIAGEGHNGLARRFAAWGQHHGVKLKGVPMFKSAGAAQFLNAASAQSVATAVDALVAAQGLPALIVVDTLARNFGGGDENSTQEMGEFVAVMDDLRARWPGAVILIVHHSGHADKGRARGAMALKGALDFEYRLEMRPGGLRVLSNTKMKDAEPPANLHFTLDTVELIEGGASAVLIPAKNSDRDDASAQLGKNARLALKAYISAAATGGIFGDEGLQGVSEADWRASFYEATTGIQSSSLPKTFKRAQDELTKANVIVERSGLHLALDHAIIMEISLKRDRPDNADKTGQS